MCALTLLVSIGLLHGSTANARGVRHYVVAQEGDVTPDPLEIGTPADVSTPTSTPEEQPTTTDAPTAEPTMPTRTVPTDTPLPPTATKVPDPTATPALTDTPLPPTVPQPTATPMPPKPDPTHTATATHTAEPTPTPKIALPIPSPSPAFASSPVEAPSSSPELVGVAVATATPRTELPTVTRLPATVTPIQTPTPSIAPAYTPPDDDALESLNSQPGNTGGTRVARTAPVGAVYTTRRTRMPDGRYTVTVCIANIGAASVPEINVMFALSQLDAAIMALQAPSVPSEVSNNQARAILRDVSPGRQVQVDVVIYSKDALRDGQPTVTVPEAYRLTSSDPTLVCSPRDAALDPADDVEAQFVIGGEAVEIDRVAAALGARLSSWDAATADQAFQAKPTEAVLSTMALRMLLIASGVLVLVLVGLSFIRWRQRRMGG
ncbi:MAG: hypothetical protein ACFLMY_01910 [Candidatus Brachytrichaceae bacterium NZ_4S206]